MKTSTDNWEGIFPYLVSPIAHDGSVNAQVLKELTEHLIVSGVHGLTPLGSTGEFFYLNWKQRKQIVSTVVEQTKGRVPVIAGIASASIDDAVFQAREFEKLGVDGILAILNVYFPLQQEEIYKYFVAIAKAVSCQVVLYNNPKFTGFEINISTLQQLVAEPNINYYKDASGNTGRLLQISNVIGDKLKIFSASAHVPLFVMMLGGVGWMAGPACLLPRESVCLYELCKQKRWDDAFQLQRIMWEINLVFQKYNLAACIKAGLEIQGFKVGNPIPPIDPLNACALEEIRSILQRIHKQTEYLKKV